MAFFIILSPFIVAASLLAFARGVVGAAAGEAGLKRAGLIGSPITGAEGNQEFLLHLRS